MARLVRARRGGAMIILAVSTPVLVGGLALGVEMGLAFVEKRQLQTQTDAAALAAAYELAKGNKDAVEAVAKVEALRNGLDTAYSPTLTVNTPPVSGNYAGNNWSVEVHLAVKQPALFSAVFRNESVPMASRAVAEVRIAANACVLATDSGADAAARVPGSARVNLTDCALASNSEAASAISLEGSAELSAETLWTAGQVNRENGVSLSVQKPPVTGAWALDDPYADLTIPTLGPCDATGLKVGGKATTLKPGVYCGGLTIEGSNSVTLEPGTYYIDGGDLQIKGQVSVDCSCYSPTDGVTFVLTDSADPTQTGTVYIAGGAKVDLRAPTSSLYDYPGVLIHQDPRVTDPGPARYEGGSAMQLTGALHFPNQAIRFAGNNSTAATRCLIVIGKTVEFTGDTDLVNEDCKAAGIKTVGIKGVFLVE